MPKVVMLGTVGDPKELHLRLGPVWQVLAIAEPRTQASSKTPCVTRMPSSHSRSAEICRQPHVCGSYKSQLLDTTESRSPRYRAAARSVMCTSTRPAPPSTFCLACSNVPSGFATWIKSFVEAIGAAMVPRLVRPPSVMSSRTRPLASSALATLVGKSLAERKRSVRGSERSRGRPRHPS
jgi:hypothetical protein